MKFKLLLIATVYLLSNTICAKTIVTVNGIKITEKEVQDLQKQAEQSLGKKINTEEIITSLIRAEAIKQVAYKKGFQKSKAVAKKLQQIRDKLVVDEYVQSLLKSIKISNKEYKKAYKKYIKTLPKHQYKASHILVKTSKEAKSIIRTLGKKGANFAAIAKKKSIGPSGKNGGSLGWFGSDSMVKEFANAVKKMKIGKYSKTPVKTKFGYHVILLEGKKSTDIPKLEEVKPNLKNQLIQPKFLKKIEAIVKKAKIIRNK